MPHIYITKTLGRHIVAGQVRNLPGTTIRAIEAEHGSSWYKLHDPDARGRHRRTQAAKQEAA